ncbi:hypothetical protein Tco_0397060 [Tanacetum coccineum]
MEIDIELVPGQCNWVSTCHARPQQQEQAYEEEEAVEEDVRGVCRDIPGHESRGLAGPSRSMDGQTGLTLRIPRDMDDQAGSTI